MSVSAAESRRRTENLINSAPLIEPLPINISVGSGRRHGDSSDVADRTRHVNGNCDDVSVLSAEQRRLTTESLRLDTAATHQSYTAIPASNRDAPRIISDGSELLNGTNGQLESGDDSHDEPLTSRPLGQVSDRSPPTSQKRNNASVGVSNDLVFVAAGHENAKLVKKPQRRDDEKNRQQTLDYCNAAQSSVKRQTAADRCILSLNHVTDLYGVRTSDVRSAEVTWRTDADECGIVDQSTSESVDRQHGSCLSSAAVAASSVQETETFSYSVSDGAVVHSTEIDTPLPGVYCDTTIPACSSRSSSINSSQVSPCQSDSRSLTDTEAGATPSSQDQPCRDIEVRQSQQVNGIGRGQKLRMLLNSHR